MVGALKNKIGAELAPAVQEIVVMFKDFLVTNKDLIRTKIVEFFKGMTWFIGLTIRAILSMSAAFLWLIKHLGNLEAITKLMMVTLTALFSTTALMAVYAMVTAFLALAAAIGVSVGELLLIPIAIAAAIGLIYLVVDDLIAYFQGRKSVTGMIADALTQGFTDAFDAIKAAWGRFKEWLFGESESTVSKIGTLLAALHPVSNIASFVTGNGLPALNFAKDFFEGGTGTGKFRSPETADAPIRYPTGSTVVQQNNTIQVNAPGANPSTVHERVESGTKSAVEELFRRGNVVTSPSVKY